MFPRVTIPCFASLDTILVDDMVQTRSQQSRGPLTHGYRRWRRVSQLKEKGSLELYDQSTP